MDQDLIRQAKETAERDLQFLKTHIGYVRAGYPHYYFPFGRDGIIAAWQMLPIDPSIARATLAFCADTQAKETNWKSEAEPGKIFHEYRILTDSREALHCTNDQGYAHHHPWGVEFPYYGTVDATPLFIYLGCEYLRQTNDAKFIKELWPHFLAAYEWIKEYGDKNKDGFIEYERQNPIGLYHQGWRDGGGDHLAIQAPVAIVEAQGYVYAAYSALFNIAEKLQSLKLINDAKQLLEELKGKIFQLGLAFSCTFWWPEEQYFYLALDKQKFPKKSIASNQGHLLFTGILNQDDVVKVAQRLMAPDMFTPYGIRTTSQLDARFGVHGYDPSSYHLGSIWPHDNWVIYEGMKRNGFIEEARKIKAAMLNMFGALKCIPELFGYDGKDPYLLQLGMRGCTYPANPIQAWAAAGILNMMNDDLE